MISRFINLSLVIPVMGDIERYRLHDLLDEYATLKSHEAGEDEKATLLLADWLVNLFENNYTLRVESIPLIKPEFDNLEKTIQWTIKEENGGLLATLATKPRNWLMNYFRELDKWQAWLIYSLDINFDDIQLKANVLQAIGDVQQFRKETDAAIESYNEALKLFRQVGAKLGEANVYLSLGGAKRESKDFAGARIDFENALKVYQRIGDQYSQARALYRLGDCLSDEEKYKDALAQYEKASQLWTAIGVTDLVESILKPRIEEAKKHF